MLRPVPVFLPPRGTPKDPRQFCVYTSRTLPCLPGLGRLEQQRKGIGQLRWKARDGKKGWREEDGNSEPLVSWLDAKEERGDGPGSYGIIYLTGRETKRTKHCRGVAPQTLRPQRSGVQGPQGDGELKLGTKVLTFVPSKVFRIMAVALRERRRKGGRCLGEEGAFCDLYLRQGFGIIKLSRGAPAEKEAKGRRSRWTGYRESLYCN